MLPADVEQAADVRMIEARDGLGLKCEACAKVRVTREFRREHLHGDLSVEARITRLIHRAHAASAERSDDLVGTETLPACRGMSLRSIRVRCVDRSGVRPFSLTQIERNHRQPTWLE